MRATWLLLLAASALAVPTASAADGLTFQQFDAPGELPQADNAGEPTIGIPWNTDTVFYQSAEQTYRIRFTEAGAPTWEDVTPLNSINNVDPMLHADPDTGRVWAGGLAGPCSIMAFSDDDGETWTPTGNMCSGAQFDHQSIGSGPYAGAAPEALYPHATYYCAQLARTACAASYDGGVSWLPFQQVLGDCGGLHGHIRVSRVTGLAAVPDNSCAGKQGFMYTDNDGTTWNSRVHPDAPASQGGFDPSLQFGREEGWLWFAQSDATGAHIALSKDEGLTWEDLGGTTWLDVGAFHDPPVVKATFSDVQVGDDDRVAYAFLGLTKDPGVDIYQCDEGQDDMVWHYYVAQSIDGGGNWTVVQATQEPVQVGGIWDGGGGEPCRNLLDFNDMDMDSTGRLYIAFADGCTGPCNSNPALATDGSRGEHAALLRQMTGPLMFADAPSDDATTGGNNDAPGDDAQDEATPLPVGVTLLAALAAMVVARKRE